MGLAAKLTESISEDPKNIPNSMLKPFSKKNDRDKFKTICEEEDEADFRTYLEG